MTLFVSQMNFRRLVAVVAPLAGLIACADDDRVVDDGCDFIRLNGRATIPAGSEDQQMLGEIAFTGFDEIEIPLRSENQDTAEEIQSVRIFDLTLELLEPGGKFLDFIDSIAFFVEAEGIERTEIARLNPFPDGQVLTGIDILDPDLELLPFATAPSMRITTEVTGLAPRRDSTIEASLGFGLGNQPNLSCVPGFE